MSRTLDGKNILLIISGGIAAYKALELIRLIGRAGGTVKSILTDGGAQFITPLSVGALSGQPVYTELFSLKDETEMGHIRLSREADLIVVAPASASLIARTAQGLADDLASTVLLATDKPVMIAPAMNPMMWENAATQDNITILRKRGFIQIGPNAGDMACGETGSGRLSEPTEILESIMNFFVNGARLKGKKALVTSGPTYEAIDPVRFIGNRSSGKQGHAIAKALRDFGADVTLVSGPTALPDPAGVNVVHVETAEQMLSACRNALPIDVAVYAAAVSDWKVKNTTTSKIKKRDGKEPPSFELEENPDILATLSQPSPKRPKLVVGFSAETDNVVEEATAKLARKKCDWIVANNVAGVFGSDNNHVHLITGQGTATSWQGPKTIIAQNLVARIADHFESSKEKKNVKAG